MKKFKKLIDEIDEFITIKLQEFDNHKFEYEDSELSESFDNFLHKEMIEEKLIELKEELK